jgi:hypothetical protein
MGICVLLARTLGRTEQRIVLEDRFQVELGLEDLVVRFERLEVLYAWFLHTSTEFDVVSLDIIILLSFRSRNLGNLEPALTSRLI